MTDEELLALNTYEEAGGEIDDGKAAISRVVWNRIARRYSSDGTVQGTVLAKDQFSWAWFGFENVHTGVGVHDLAKREYLRLSHTVTEAQQVAQDLYDLAPPADLAACRAVNGRVFSGAYRGDLYDQLTDDVVLYLNPRILTKLPTWAIPEKLVCTIGHHEFYRP